jgi:4-alpha-glucanotransferase
MQAARILRVDHVMGLHRIYCIPERAEAAAGAYLRYRPEEWYAILSIESHRHKTVLVGEDLGLVPGAVRRAMARHRLNRMFVLYYEMDGIAAGRTPEPSAKCLASLNTHDMPPFASMWKALDICEHERIGIVKPEQVAAAVKARRKVVRAFSKLISASCPEAAAGGLEDVLRCTLGWLGAGRARYVMVNVEDLWLETGQQNVPGVGAAYPGWRQRTAVTLEQMWRDPRLERALELLRTAMGRSPRR